MNDVIAHIARLPPEKRARLLSSLRSSRVPGAQPPQSEEVPLCPREGRADPAASFAQEQLWYLTQLAPDMAAYNVPFLFELDGPLDVAALERSLTEIVRRQEILRTKLELRGGRLLQIISSGASDPLPVIDLSDRSNPENEARARADELARLPFDLSRAPLYRCELLRLDRAGRRHVFVWILSHAVVDGWSIGVLLRELGALYPAFLEGRTPPPPRSALQFADYACWQRAHLSEARLEQLVSYWRRQLEGAPAQHVPADYPRPAFQTFRGATHLFQFSSALTERIMRFARARGASPFMVLFAGYQALLARYSGQNDVTTVTIVAGRTRAEMEPMLGSFVNALLLRTRLSGEAGFSELLEQVRGLTADAFAHQELPFGKLVERLRAMPGFDPDQLCRTVFTFGNTPLADPEPRLGPELAVRWSGISNGAVRFDFELAIDELSTGLRGRFDYRVDLLRAETAARFCDGYLQLLDSLLEQPDRPLSQHEALPLPAPDIARPPEREVAAPSNKGEENAPRNPTEEKLAEVWKEMLEIGALSIHDDFFDLGGHSLLAGQMVARLRDDFGVDLALVQFLEACTIAELAGVLDHLQQEKQLDEGIASQVLDHVERLSEAEVSAMLARLTKQGGA